MKKTTWLILGFGGFAGLYLVALATMLLATDPLKNPLSSWPLFPVACSTRGCITTTSWKTQHQLTTSFQTLTGKEAPTLDQSLTSAVRKHLVDNSFLRSPIGASDAKRYRENILHATADEQIQKYVPLSLGEYDQKVLEPFLKQEALRAQYKVESTDELYAILADERFILMPLLHYRWDASSGKASMR